MNMLPMACKLLPPNNAALLSPTKVKVNVLHGGGRSPVTVGELHVPEDTHTSFDHQKCKKINVKKPHIDLIVRVHQKSGIPIYATLHDVHMKDAMHMLF